MTLNDLKEEISTLGFESEISADRSFIIAVRRALATVYTERTVYKSIWIEHYPQKPTLIFDRLTHNPSVREVFILNGEAYSFTVSGSGSFSLTDNGVKTVHRFDTPTHVFKGFIHSGAELEFFGENEFNVINLATFERKHTDDENKIHVLGRPYEYSMSELVSDFHSHASLPTDEREAEIKGSSLCGDKVLLPVDYFGRVHITYKAAPPKISLDSSDTELDIPKETEHLIALLSGACYWLDDDFEKANFYLALYNDALNSVKKNDTRRLGGGYRDVTRWA